MYVVKERRHTLPEIPKGNGTKPVIPEVKPEKAKKHIRRSGKQKRRRKNAQTILPC